MTITQLYNYGVFYNPIKFIKLHIFIKKIIFIMFLLSYWY